MVDLAQTEADNIGTEADAAAAFEEEENRRYDYENGLVNFSQYLLNVYTHSEMPILLLGVIGHVLSLVVMFKSKNMQTPAFFYHRCLTISQLAYIVGCFAQKGIDYFFKMAKLSFTYSEYFGAFYSAYVNRLIWSTAGYIILYMTLMLAVDRFIALRYSASYHRFNRKRVTVVVISVVITVSLVINSLGALLENRIETSLISNDQLSVSPTSNTTNITLYQLKTRTGPAALVLTRKVTNWYNLVFRISSLFVLIALTIAVIQAFRKQRNIQRLYPESQSGRQEPQDRILFHLLIINVPLVFAQVICTETRRIVEITHPYSELLKQVDNEVLTLATRLHLLDVMYYGHVSGKIIANLWTFISRSVNFYLYFCFSSAFRAENLKIVCSLCSAKNRRGSTRSDVSLRTSLTSPTTLKDDTLDENPEGCRL